MIGSKLAEKNPSSVAKAEPDNLTSSNYALKFVGEGQHIENHEVKFDEDRPITMECTIHSRALLEYNQLLSIFGKAGTLMLIAGQQGGVVLFVDNEEGGKAPADC